ncbi:MAG: ATP-binding protein [Pseudomonadota bacterium]
MDFTLKYLLLIRLFVIGGQVLGLLVMDIGFDAPVLWLPVNLILAAMAAFTLYSWRRTGEPSAKIYLVQSLADIFALSALIFFSGGPFNPFTALFLIPIVFAAAAMSVYYLSIVTLLALGAYTFLMFFRLPSEHVHGGGAAFELHIWGMWYGFVVSALCVALFVARMARRLRSRDQTLAEIREQSLRDDKIMTLGALAAGTAHELGTPLSTVSILAAEIEAQSSNREDISDNVLALRNEVQRCKEILARLAVRGDEAQRDQDPAVDVDRYFQLIVDEWRNLHPEIAIEYTTTRSSTPPVIAEDRVVTQAIQNVLNNAANAARNKINVATFWDEEQFGIEIRDDGPGIPKATLEQLGKRPLDDPSNDGLGLGVFLANTIITRLGGSLSFNSQPGQGVLARIAIPVAAMIGSSS